MLRGAVVSEGLVSVFLVEDEEAVRDQLAAAIEEHPDLMLLDAVGTCAEAEAFIQDNELGLLVTDLGLPDGHGCDLVRLLRLEQETVPSLVVSVFGDEEHVIQAIAAGANGYLLKDGNVTAMTKAMMQVVHGGAPISSSVSHYLLDRFRSNRHVFIELSAQEQRALEGISLGYSYKEIAEQMAVSYHTVNTYIKRVYDKLQVHSRKQAVYEARIMGLIDSPDDEGEAG